MFEQVRVTHIALIMVLTLMFTGCFGWLITPDPSFTVEGVENDELYTEPVTPVIKAGKGTTLTITLNDEEFASGTEITEPGTYELIIVGENKKGETVSDTISFIIAEFPQIAVAGVEDGKKYTDPVTIEITTDNPATDTVVITLNGEAFTAGTTVSTPGAYELVVEATNVQEVKSTLTLSFSIYETLELAIGENVTPGFGSDKGTTEINEDVQFIKTGVRSLKFTNETGTKSCFRIQRSPHPQWPADWTKLEKFTFWVYIEDASLMSSDLEYVLATPAGTKTKNFTLVNGWNFCEINIPDLAGGDLDQLVGMDDAPGGKGSYFLDIILRSGNEVLTFYLDDFTFWWVPTE